MRALGETESFVGCSLQTDDVILWRAVAKGMPSPPSVRDLLLLGKAAAKASEYFMNLRGIAVRPLSGSQHAIDVVMTGKYPIPLHPACGPGGVIGTLVGAPESGAELGEQVVADPEVRAAMPKLELSQMRYELLVGPPAAVDAWLAHGLLYESGVGPTDAYAEGKGVYVGSADQAPAIDAYSPTPPPEIGKQGADDAGQISVSDVLWVGAAAVGLYVAHRALRAGESPDRRKTA